MPTPSAGAGERIGPSADFLAGGAVPARTGAERAPRRGRRDIFPGARGRDRAIWPASPRSGTGGAVGRPCRRRWMRAIWLRRRASRQRLDAPSTACPDALGSTGSRPPARRSASSCSYGSPTGRVRGSRHALLQRAGRDRGFFHAHRGDIVYKTYKLGVWAEQAGGGRLRVNYTSAVAAESLADTAAPPSRRGFSRSAWKAALRSARRFMGESDFSVRIEPADEAGRRGDRLARAAARQAAAAPDCAAVANPGKVP